MFRRPRCQWLCVVTCWVPPAFSNPNQILPTTQPQCFHPLLLLLILQPHPSYVVGLYNGAHKDDWIIRLAQFAVAQHNHREGKHLQYVRVVGASHTMFSSMLYHITVEALNVNRPKIYHAIVWMQIFKNFEELLVWMPVSDCFSSLAVKSGDLRLHEAVMLYMNQAKKGCILT